MSPAQGSYLVGLIGISNTIARLILGALSQKLNRLFLYNTCLVICGLTMALSNYFQPIMASIAGLECNNEPLNLILNATTVSGQYKKEPFNHNPSFFCPTSHLFLFHKCCLR